MRITDWPTRERSRLWLSDTDDFGMMMMMTMNDPSGWHSEKGHSGTQGRFSRRDTVLVKLQASSKLRRRQEICCVKVGRERKNLVT